MAKLRLRRAGKRFEITFARARSASYYLVKITASDGRHLLELTRRHSLTKPVVGYADHLSVTVTAVSAMGRHGRSAGAASRR